MSNFDRKIKRNKEKQQEKELKMTYGKKPKYKCPKCKSKSLFMVNADESIFCVKCDSIVGLKKN